MIEYLEEIHNKHEEWLHSWDKTKVLIINNNNDNDWNTIINNIIKYCTN
jgi:hypothetical protein